MTSCFEGLLEYYRVTGTEKYKTAVVNFANKVLESDFTIIGSSGCTHELFDHSAVRQANRLDCVAQETCVTVTLMKFFYQMTLLTGDAKYSDAFETSLYNAYLGAINTEKSTGKTGMAMPFDSYSPLVAGIRGTLIAGGLRFSDNTYYGCCACIGSAGTGLIPKMALLTTKKGFAYNLYINGNIKSATPAGNEIEFVTSTKYPADGKVNIKLNISEEENFEILIRNPKWSKGTKLSVNGKKTASADGYVSIERTWKNGDMIDIEFDMRTELLRPTPYRNQVLMNKVIWGVNYVVPQYDEEDPLAKKHIALRRGPVILAQENRLGYSVDTPISVKASDDGYVDVKLPEKDSAPYKHIIEVCIPLEDGGYMSVTDYASAGKLWTEESKMAAWMLVK